MEETILFDNDFLDRVKSIASEGIHNVAHGFSGMVGRRIQFSQPDAKLVSLLTIPELVSKPDDEMVGVYLRFKGDMVGQIMMIISHDRALELVDLLMGMPSGTTRFLGSLERSALGELGNLCGAFFFNSVTKIVNINNFHLSPPVVLVDMAGAILDIVVTASGVGEQVLLMQTNFMDGSRSVEADFWIIPDMNLLHASIKKKPEA